MSQRVLRQDHQWPQEGPQEDPPDRSFPPDRSGPPGRPIKRRSIGVRLSWSYLVSSTLPLILIGALLIFLNFRIQRELVFNEQVVLARQASHDISSYISNMETQLLRMGRELLGTETQDERNRVIQELIEANFPYLREISMFNTEGGEIARLSQQQTFSPDTLIRRTNDPMIHRALRGMGGRSDPFFDKDGQIVLTIALPLRNNETGRDVVGAIRANISTTPIKQILNEPGRGTPNTAYLLNDSLEVVLSGLSASPHSPSNDLAASLVSAEEIPYQPGNSRILIYENDSQERILAAVSPVNPGTWSVVVEKPLDTAFGNVWNTVLLLGMLVGVVGVLGLSVGVLLSRQILRPLTKLREGALSLGRGQLDHRIIVEGSDELAQLARTFNQMAGRLQTSLSEIEAQNERLRQGLVLARDIQMGLLPSRPPWDHSLLMVDAWSVPAYEVGGDFYSYLTLSDGIVAVSVGDISGKGVGTALMMALTSSMLESHARQVHQPAELLTTLNHLLYVRFQANKMNAAMLYAIFDLHNRTMTVANAGMISPLLIRRTKGPEKASNSLSGQSSCCTMLDVGGFPIGALANPSYQNLTISLDAGDMVLFVSDGIVEAHNEQGEMFGFERLEKLCSEVTELDTIHQLIDALLRRIQEFMGRAEQHDDMTIVAVSPSLGAATGVLQRNVENRYEQEQMQENVVL